VSRLSTSIADDFGLSAFCIVMSLNSTIVTYHIVLRIWTSPIWIWVWISRPWSWFKGQIGCWLSIWKMLSLCPRFLPSFLFDGLLIILQSNGCVNYSLEVMVSSQTQLHPHIWVQAFHEPFHPLFFCIYLIRCISK
jgi:hypothetical protein